MVDFVFIAIAIVTVGGAIAALEADEIVYGAIALAGSLFGVAAFFFLLNAQFVAVFQITVYVGAIAVLILFTVMLVRQESWAKEVSAKSPTRFAGIVAGVAIAGSIAFAVGNYALASSTAPQGALQIAQIGQEISTTYAPVLEVLALVLAASVIGALTLARIDKKEASD